MSQAPTSPADLKGLLERLLDEAEKGAASGNPPNGSSLSPSTPLVQPPAADVPPPSHPPAADAVTAAIPSGPSAAASSSAVSSDPSAAVSSAPPSPAGGDGSPLGALLANPALLTALPTLMENLSPLLGGLGRGTGSAPTATRPRTLDRHTALLCAIKPYLSPARRDAAETVIRLARVWDALESSGISVTGLLRSVGSALPARDEGGDHRV
jgi:hypothetical protein